MIASLAAVAAALTIGLPILALGEHVRESHLPDQDTSPNRQETP
nr:MAG TPA: hypothetical protein [Caudoviricetes sp.]